MHVWFDGGCLRERDYLEDQGVDGRKILKWLFTKYDGGMDRTDLGQDNDRWLAVVNTVMNITFPQNTGNCLNR